MPGENVNRCSRGVNLRNPLLRCSAVLLAVMLLPLILGAWRIMTGYTINPHYVQRIKDGQTTKHEILLYFGDPKEIQRTPDGTVYVYKSFKDAPAMAYRPEDRKINPQSDQLMVIDDNKQIKKAPLKTEGKILRSTLTVRFKADGETVMSHEYKEYKDKE
jgi:outer membrane protein assembly factor BamE (lipoprotein component of BamABCDE complex)